MEIFCLAYKKGRDALEKIVHFTEEELFHVGWGRFCRRENALREILDGNLVHSCGKVELSVDFDFFRQMMELGKRVILEKIKQKNTKEQLLAKVAA